MKGPYWKDGVVKKLLKMNSYTDRPGFYLTADIATRDSLINSKYYHNIRTIRVTHEEIKKDYQDISTNPYSLSEATWGEASFDNKPSEVKRTYREVDFIFSEDVKVYDNFKFQIDNIYMPVGELNGSKLRVEILDGGGNLIFEHNFPKIDRNKTIINI